MNLLDAKITRVTGESYQEWGKWWRPVVYDCWGSPGNTNVMCATKEQADAVKVGDMILV